MPDLTFKPPQDPLDFTNRYNTQLGPQWEPQFQAWASKNNKLGDLYDYDLRGCWLANGCSTDEHGHGTDLFKKPNHPSFSDQSIYHGIDGMQGGRWDQDGDKWSFTPSPHMRRMHEQSGLESYFETVEPDVELRMPNIDPDVMKDMLQTAEPESGVPAHTPYGESTLTRTPYRGGDVQGVQGEPRS